MTFSSDSSLRAILFDFDGVLADTEPIHFQMFQQVLKDEQIDLTEEIYYERYLGLDDRGCFRQVYRDQNRPPLDDAKLEDLIRTKHDIFIGQVRRGYFLLPGALELIERIHNKYFLAVVSGALKSEIMEILKGAKLEQRFHVIVAADDVSQGKPHPEGYQTAVRLLNRDFVPESEILVAGECLVIEDSPWGIEAAHQAGNKCLALMTSYPREKLAGADLTAPDLKHVKWDQVEALFTIKE